MLRFLKLTDIIINVSHIRFIKFNPKEYKIELSTNYFKGTMILGSGEIRSHESIITVCEKEHPDDYKLVTEWITKN